MILWTQMKTTWVIENFAKEQSFKELSAACKELGQPMVEINGDYSAKDLTNRLLNIELTEKVGDNGVFDMEHHFCVIANGSIKMCKLLQQDIGRFCYPIQFASFEKYKCSAYYSHYGEYLFNDKYCMMSLKEVIRQKYDVWGHYGKDGMLFIRPDSGEKLFQAGLLDIVDLPRLWDTNKDIEHELVLVSTPKNILWEGRFVVSKQHGIIASSTYRFQGKVCIIPSVPTETTAFCKRLLEKVDYVPDPVFCFDICQDTDKNCWLMELTSFSSAGLYATDKKAIIQKVSEIAEAEYAKTLAA